MRIVNERIGEDLVYFRRQDALRAYENLVRNVNCYHTLNIMATPLVANFSTF